MNIEKALYESRPAFYFIIGALAYFNSGGSRTILVCGFLILLGATLVFTMRAAHRNFEQAWYDLRPYLYVIGALATIYFYKNSGIALASSLLLLFCATMIIRWRNSRVR